MADWQKDGNSKVGCIVWECRTLIVATTRLLWNAVKLVGNIYCLQHTLMVFIVALLL